MADQTTPPGISTREKIGIALMTAGFAALVGGIAALSLPWAAIIGGGVLLTAGVAVDRMS